MVQLFLIAGTQLDKLMETSVIPQLRQVYYENMQNKEYYFDILPPPQSVLDLAIDRKASMYVPSMEQN